MDLVLPCTFHQKPLFLSFPSRACCCTTLTLDDSFCQGFRIFNTWLGDPSKIVFLEELNNVIRRENLLDTVTSVGKQLVRGMTQLQVTLLCERFSLFRAVNKRMEAKIT